MCVCVSGGNEAPSPSPRGASTCYEPRPGEKKKKKKKEKRKKKTWRSGCAEVGGRKGKGAGGRGDVYPTGTSFDLMRSDATSQSEVRRKPCQLHALTFTLPLPDINTRAFDLARP